MRTFLHYNGKVEEVTEPDQPALTPLPPCPEDEKHPRPRKHHGRTAPVSKCNLVGLTEDGSAPPRGGTTPKQIERATKVCNPHKATGLIVCAKCGKTWERKPQRGRPWTKCPKCR